MGEEKKVEEGQKRGKILKFAGKDPAAPAQVATEKVTKVKKEKVARIKKEKLVLKATGAEVKETKFVSTAKKGEKRMWIRGSAVGLTVKISGLNNFKAVSEEEAKKGHLGKTRMLGKVSTQEELDEVVAKYFE